MGDEEWYKPHRPPVPPRQRVPGDLLFECLRGRDRFPCELRDHGEAFGVEAQFYQNEEFLVSRRFDPSLSRTQSPRDLAVQWAMLERKYFEDGGA
jgi:hypothetical protein